MTAPVALELEFAKDGAQMLVWGFPRQGPRFHTYPRETSSEQKVRRILLGSRAEVASEITSGRYSPESNKTR